MTTQNSGSPETLVGQIDLAFRGWLEGDFTRDINPSTYGRFLLTVEGGEPLLFCNGAVNVLLGSQAVHIEVGGEELDGGFRVATLTPDTVFNLSAV